MAGLGLLRSLSVLSLLGSLSSVGHKSWMRLDFARDRPAQTKASCLSGIALILSRIWEALLQIGGSTNLRSLRSENELGFRVKDLKPAYSFKVSDSLKMFEIGC